MAQEVNSAAASDRDGMGQSQATNKQGRGRYVITNALIVDHWASSKPTSRSRRPYQRDGRAGIRISSRRHHCDRPRHRTDRG